MKSPFRSERLTERRENPARIVPIFSMSFVMILHRADHRIADAG
jgi:hypothetical protein